MEIESNIFGSRLRTVRKSRNMSQLGLGIKLSISERSINNWERGMCSPDVNTLRYICCRLNVSADYMLGLSEKEKSAPNAGTFKGADEKTSYS